MTPTATTQRPAIQLQGDWCTLALNSQVLQQLVSSFVMGTTGRRKEGVHLRDSEQAEVLLADSWRALSGGRMVDCKKDEVGGVDCMTRNSINDGTLGNPETYE